jgi:hypothetical protein
MQDQKSNQKKPLHKLTLFRKDQRDQSLGDIEALTFCKREGANERDLRGRHGDTVQNEAARLK